MAFHKKAVQGRSTRRFGQMSLVCTDTDPAYPTGSGREGVAWFDEYCRRRAAKRLATGLICRLRIPPGTTVVGLLGVGPSHSNRDEVLNWVEQELRMAGLPESDDGMSELCRRFLAAIDDRATDLEFVGISAGVR